MSTKTARHTLSRQWELLKMLPTRPPGATARELTARLNDAGFSVSKRQIERDLNELSAIFPISCNDKSTPYGWYWAKGASLELPGLSAAEALSTYLTESVITPLLPASVVEVMKPRFEQAKNKLNSLSGHSVLPNWTEKVAHVPPMLPQLPPKVDEQVLETVQLALLHGKQMQVTYHAANKPSAKQYILHALGLVQRGVATYVVGRVDAYDNPHIFALQRIQHAELLDRPAVPPEDFTLKQFLIDGGMQFSGGSTVKLKALIHPHLVQSIAESPLGEDQTLSTPGSECDWPCLEVTVHDSWQLRWWVLSLGEMIEVLEPVELRDEVVERLKGALGRYLG